MVTIPLLLVNRDPLQRTQQLYGDEALCPVAAAAQDHPHRQQWQLGWQESYGEVL